MAGLTASRGESAQPQVAGLRAFSKHIYSAYLKNFNMTKEGPRHPHRQSQPHGGGCLAQPAAPRLWALLPPPDCREVGPPSPYSLAEAEGVGAHTGGSPRGWASDRAWFAALCDP